MTNSIDGQPWEYDGKYSQSVFARGWGIKTHSQILMQGDFPAGTYTIQIQVDNQNEVEDIDGNGMLKVLSIDQHGTWEHSWTVMNHGYQSKEISLTLTKDFNLIGFQVGRIGRGNHFEMMVYEVKIISYQK